MLIPEVCLSTLRLKLLFSTADLVSLLLRLKLLASCVDSFVTIYKDFIEAEILKITQRMTVYFTITFYFMFLYV